MVDFQEEAFIKNELWGREIRAYECYIATVVERADLKTVEKDTQRQGKLKEELMRLKL